MILVVRWIIAIVVAYIFGKIISKFKLPSLLGWLIAGMVLGPYALGIMNNQLIENDLYQIILKVLECGVGLMIGTELVFKDLKKSGKGLVVTTVVQSLGTYVFVSLVFSLIFAAMDIPVYLGFIFGGIALATAPAPALSIVQEFKTSGPVTRTLVPMAALDDVVGVICFFTTISLVVMKASGGNLSFSIVPIMIFLPLVIGVITGIPGGFLLRKFKSKIAVLSILVTMIIGTAALGFFFNGLMPAPVLNFMLMGMAFSATFSNMVGEETLKNITNYFDPILSFSMIVVIANLGVPLDYKAILGAGAFTVVYIVSRGIGKYFGARLGAKISDMPREVQKYLGFTLLPHSGVSLVFTGIAVSVLGKTHHEYAVIIQGTIAAAAVINEIIAVIIAKKGFEWAGEIDK